MRLLIASASLALAACNATLPTTKAVGPRDDPTFACYDGLDAGRTDLAPIIARTGSLALANRSSLEQMAETSKPSPEERPLISAWAAARQNCLDAGASFRAVNAPSPYRSAFEQGQSRAMILIARLYAGELSWGEFNRARRELAMQNSTNLRAAGEQIRAEEQAEDSRRLSATRDALLIQQMLAPTPIARPAQLPAPPRTVNCTSRNVLGSIQTTCN